MKAEVRSAMSFTELSRAICQTTFQNIEQTEAHLDEVTERSAPAAFSPNDSEPIYAIGEMAKRAEVAVQTLRMYERAGLILPSKTASGRRRYSKADLRLVQCLRRLIKEKRMNLAKACGVCLRSCRVGK